MRRKKLSLIEMLIILAVIGIIIAIASQSPSSGPRRAHARRHGPSASPARVSTEGRGNTIEGPQSRRERAPEAVPVAGRVLRGLIRIVFSSGLIILLPILYLRYRMAQRHRRPRRHPPEAPEG